MTLDPPQPELLAEYQLIIYFTSEVATHARPVADLAEAEAIGARLGDRVAWSVRARHVTPWRDVGPVVRNRVTPLPVDQDDVMDLHPHAVPAHRHHNPPRRPRPEDTPRADSNHVGD